MSATATDIALRVTGPLLVAAIVGLFGYSATRAGTSDLDKLQAETSARQEVVRREITDLEEKITRRLDELEHIVTEGRVSDAKFQGEVKRALGIETD